MIISYKKKFILMSPWKTASSTCNATLAHLNESPYDRFFYFNPHLNRVVHQHITMADLMALPEGRGDFLKAAFVRNPYDRAYSGFLQIQRDFAEHPRRQFPAPWIAELVKNQIVENMARVVSAAFDFNTWLASLPEYEVLDVGRNSSMVLHPAHYWTHINGKQIATFIGTVENFETDFDALCMRLKVERPATMLANANERDTKATGAAPCRYSDRFNARSRDKINALFDADFTYFAYEKLT